MELQNGARERRVKSISRDRDKREGKKSHWTSNWQSCDCVSPSHFLHVEIRFFFCSLADPAAVCSDQIELPTVCPISWTICIICTVPQKCFPFSAFSLALMENSKQNITWLKNLYLYYRMKICVEAEKTVEIWVWLCSAASQQAAIRAFIKYSSCPEVAAMQRFFHINTKLISYFGSKTFFSFNKKKSRSPRQW